MGIPKIEDLLHRIKYPDLDIPLKVLIISGKPHSSIQRNPDDFLDKLIGWHKHNIAVFDNSDLLVKIRSITYDIDLRPNGYMQHKQTERFNGSRWTPANKLYYALRKYDPYMFINHTLRSVEKYLQTWGDSQLDQKYNRGITEGSIKRVLPTLLIIKGKISDYDLAAIQYSFGKENVHKLSQKLGASFPRSTWPFDGSLYDKDVPKYYHSHIKNLAPYAGNYVDSGRLAPDERRVLYINMVNNIFKTDE